MHRTNHRGWCYFPSVGTEIKCNNSLFSVRMDGNLYAYIRYFLPYGRKIANYYTYENSELLHLRTEIKSWISLFSVRTNRWRHIIAQSSSTYQINETDPNANPNPNPNPNPTPNPTKPYWTLIFVRTLLTPIIIFFGIYKRNFFGALAGFGVGQVIALPAKIRRWLM